MKYLTLALCLYSFVCSCTCVADDAAKLKLPSIFSDHMVLQRNQTNKVWGKAPPNCDVTIQFAEQEISAQSNENGEWSAQLPSLKAGGPYELHITAADQQLSLQDILVGEVWICSGQSNMEWPMRNVNDFELHRLAANQPQIRTINFPNLGQQTPVWTHDNQWQTCSPESIGSFSGVAYFFGKQLHQTLDVPIGLVNNSWGGSSCEAWIPRHLLESDDRFQGLIKRWQQIESNHEKLAALENRSAENQKKFEQSQRLMRGNHRPGNIYNGILTSHIGYGIKGVIWYQGESNANRAYQYRELFPLMIQTWRNEWDAGDFPFYWAQLADFRAETQSPRDSDWAELREAQTMTLSLPNTAQAVIIDAGEGKDIHPRDKETVGRRLARCALAREYGFKITYQSPTFASMKIENEKAIISFNHAEEGWRLFDVRTPLGFSIAGEDKKFYPAQATILDDGKITVMSQNVPTPVSVRYGWADNPIVNVFTKSNLPLTPFRTDDWPGITAANQ